jgi:hypothetical protein
LRIKKAYLFFRSSQKPGILRHFCNFLQAHFDRKSKFIFYLRL